MDTATEGVCEEAGEGDKRPRSPQLLPEPEVGSSGW